MSNVNKNESIISAELINKNNIAKLKNILLAQRNDPICKLLYDKNIELYIYDYKEEDFGDINISHLEIPGELIDNVDDDGNTSVGEIFDYLKNKFPFIVTVPEKHVETLLGNGHMIPVEPSDEPGNFGFKGTIGIDPYIEGSTKRYIVKVNPNLYDNLYPFFPYNEKCYKNGILDRNLIDDYDPEPFRGVGFFPLANSKVLKNIENYEVLGFYSGDELDDILLTEELDETKEKILKVL